MLLVFDWYVWCTLQKQNWNTARRSAREEIKKNFQLWMGLKMKW